MPLLSPVQRVVGIPVEFILFATVLLGVALFHHYTFPIAAGGALMIALYKIFFSPFATGAGWSGFGAHLLHEWVILINLLLLLLGFALLAKHFEDSGVPNALPRYPPRRLEGLLCAARDRVRAVELSRQHRGGIDRRRDGAHGISRQGAYRLSGGDCRGSRMLAARAA